MTNQRRSIGAILAIAAAAGALPAPARAQAAPVQTGETLRSSAGTPGQRQTRDQASVNAAPTGRLNARLRNRVPARLETRLDRNYNVDADAGDRIRAAADQARIATAPK